MMDYTLFGESHGSVVGVLIRNVPVGLTVDNDFLAADLMRRQARGHLATSRHEPDEVEYLSGVFEGKTTGMPLVAILRNHDPHSDDYDALRTTPRPGHADYTAWVKSDGQNDYRGGGHFSGRLTAPLVAAGAIAKEYLKTCGVTVSAAIVEEESLRLLAAEAKVEGDSVGGQIRCTVTGVPVGVGGPDWRDTLEGEISRHVFAVPAVKAIAFGAGEELSGMRGSEANDSFYTDGKKVMTTTNHSGGINGGISNGMPVEFTVTFRPTPSIAKRQQTVDLATMTNTTIEIRGRHDPCVALRAAPAVEAATALALCKYIEPLHITLPVLRQELDLLDSELVALLEKRLSIAQKIGEIKRSENLSVMDAAREKSVLQSRGDLLPAHREAVEELFRTLMALSRKEQEP